MEFKNCKRCKAVFTGGGDLCFKCKEEENDNFVKVRDYILCNPQSDIKTVARETQVDEKLIFSFLREKRIRATEGLEGSMKCEKCGTPISSGRFCEPCQKKFLSVIQKPLAVRRREEEENKSANEPDFKVQKTTKAIKTGKGIKNYEYMSSGKNRN